MTSPVVSILMGSDSDLATMRGASAVLADFGIEHEVRVMSAHRTPEAVAQHVSGARDRGVRVIIAGAGMAAHLAGVVAAHTDLPVIGVPLRSSAALDGVDALYATVQMPPGVPVATVGIDGAKNAAHLAVRILGVADPDVAAELQRQRDSMADQVRSKDARLQELGVDAYLKSKN